LVTPRLAAIVMAAGLGTRMRSDRPKHLHPLLGRRVLDWALAATEPLAPDPLVVVCSPETRDEFARTLPEEADLVVQAEPRGTGDAVAAASGAFARFDGDILVLDGSAPLLTGGVLAELVAEHRRAKAVVTVLSIEPVDALPYGRVLRDAQGNLRAIVEAGDANEEELAVRELNTSIYVFSARELWPVLERLEDDNVQGEVYLTDAVRELVADGNAGAVYRAPDPIVGLGVNNRAELAQAGAELRARVAEAHMLAGVTIVDPGSTWIEADVEIEPDAVIHPFTVLRGRTVVRAGAEVGPHAVAVDAEIGPRATVGPFSYLRPGTVLAAEAHFGAFGEVKNSTIGERTKVPHLSYIGDAEIGEDSNIAAGAITANYRPELGAGEKQRTVIGRNVHTGSDNVFVAPVEIGDDAWIGAGSTITEDVPAGALAVARARQVNREGYGGKRND
jgi:bifunctional UDP-N-acetylglucosamine pyrophosphorylase / glucosamine-1-phosphate N-acetyltransferase